MTPMALALGILAITIICFIWEPFPIAVTAILASLSYGFFGIVKMNTVFAAYDNNTNILLAGMMVVGASLFHTGITDAIGKKMVALTGKSERNIILATLIVSCILSSVCSNIGVMVAMAPLVTAMCVLELGRPGHFWACCLVLSSEDSSRWLVWDPMLPQLLPWENWD